MTDLSSALPLDRRRMFQLAAVLGGSMALASGRWPHRAAPARRLRPA
ncbi:hypothetical protein ACFS32_13335 [Novosphingobium pokkalii]